ncbi:hypothetical protein CLOM_g10528 [Closterium sp. NIES-68]|nr:hypothetical protein CLOM_g10528 [Closterium sp. NIES-68]GJP60622.1 hypothetical protein CLOP_g17850 [Closterium sp. NIES-67]
MSEKTALMSTTFETEGSNIAPSGESPQPDRGGDDAKVTVAKNLVSRAGASPSRLKRPGKDGLKGTAELSGSSSNLPGLKAASGWNDTESTDKSSAIFNIHDRPVRDAAWRFVFLVPLVLLVATGLRLLFFPTTTTLFNPFTRTSNSPLPLILLVSPFALLLLFALSLPLPVFLVASLRRMSARTLKALVVAAAVIWALQCASSAERFLSAPPDAAEEVSPFQELIGNDPFSLVGNEFDNLNFKRSSDFSVGTDVGERAEGGMGESGEMMEGGMGVGGMQGGMAGGMGGTAGAQEGWLEIPSEAQENSADGAAPEDDSSSSSSAPMSGIGRRLLESALPSAAHPVVAATASHAAHWVHGAVHSAVRRRLQSRVDSLAGESEGGQSSVRVVLDPHDPQFPQFPQVQQQLLSMAPMARRVERPIDFLGFVSFGLLSALAVLLLLRCSHHLPLVASVIAHTAHATIAQAPVILFLALPSMLAALLLALPLIDGILSGNHLVLSILLFLPFLFVLQVLATLVTYSASAIFARLYVPSGGSNYSKGNEGLQRGGEGEKPAWVTIKGQLELFRSALSLACTSSLGTCCAIFVASTSVSILKFILSALSFALFGQGVLGYLLAALIRCAEVALQFFLHCLVLPTSAMSGHGFTRSVRLSLDILQRFLVPIVVANAAALALLVMLMVPVFLINALIGLFGGGAIVGLYYEDLGPFAFVFLLGILLITLGVSLLSMAALSFVLTTGVSTTVLCFAWDQKLDAQEGLDVTGLVGGCSLKACNEV